MKTPSVSIIILTHNHEAYVKEAVESALSQKGDEFDLEIIAVDDYSNDNTWTQLLKLSQEHDFTAIKTPGNVGPSAARNLALKQAKGDWINFLDGDDYFLPHKIATQLKSLKKHPKAAVCYTDCLIKLGKKIEDNPLSRIWPPAQGQIYTHLLLRNCIALHAGLIKGDLAKQYKFDELLWTAEDYDFWLRISHDGTEFLYINKPLVVYRRSRTSLSKPSQEVFDNTLRVLDRNQKLIRTDQQRKNLNYHRSVILQNKADIYLQAFEKQGRQLLLQAQGLGSLPRYKLVSLRVMEFSFWLGILFYKALDFRSRYRSKWWDRRKREANVV